MTEPASASAHLDDLNLLAAYAEDRLGAEERHRVTEHLTRCRGCRGALAALARESTAKEAIEVVKSDEARPADSRVLGLRPITWLPIAATVAIATVSGIVLLRTMQTPAPNAPVIGGPTDSTVRAPGHETRQSRPEPGSPPETLVPERPPEKPATVDPGLLLRRGARREIAGKSFRLVAGEWIDAAYDPLAGLPGIDAATAEETAELARRVPALAPYTRLSPRVLVVHDGTVYRLRTSR